jgi:hypothetical protein
LKKDKDEPSPPVEDVATDTTAAPVKEVDFSRKTGS